MLKLKKWLLSLLAMAVIAVPVMAGNNDAKTANDNTANATSAEASPAAPSPILTSTAVDANVSTSSPDPDPAPQSSASAPQGAPPPVPPPAVVLAVAPVRVLTVDPPRKDGLVPAFKAGAVRVTPYGFIKATAAHDFSMPNGDDFPLIGLFTGSATGNQNTGPTKDPEFHIKARGSRFGTNFEWPDASPKLTFTGRVEADFEGNFSVAHNRNVSSLRSNALSLRLAYVRMDYAASENSDFYFEGGEEWRLFGSSALPNLLETTFFGAYYGNVYERSPQMMVGWVQKLGGSMHLKISPAFAIMMPSSAQVESGATNAFSSAGAANGVAGQLGEAEREGADSDRPEYEGRLAVQFRLNKEPGVAPAQLIWSGFYAKRTSIVAGAVMKPSGDLLPAGCTGTPAEVALSASYAAALPNGYTATSKMYGNQLPLQLPTRWFPLVAGAYKGGDLRFMFGGQANSFNTDYGGLVSTSAIKFETMDGLGNAAVACSVTPDPVTGCPIDSVVVAPERPIRSFGGFINLGLPLSRWFNANPQD